MAIGRSRVTARSLLLGTIVAGIAMAGEISRALLDGATGTVQLSAMTVPTMADGERGGLRRRHRRRPLEHLARRTTCHPRGWVLANARST